MNKARILFVGEFEESFLKQIHHDDWEIKHCLNSQEAIKSVEEEVVDLIVARDSIGQLNGYQLCTFLKSHPQIIDLPFIILANKKSKNFNLSLYVSPNRLAEYSEVIKKPLSLAKLIREDLSQFYKTRKQKIDRSKKISLLPTGSMQPGKSSMLQEISDELLLERYVATQMLNILRKAKAKQQLIKEYFSAVKNLLRLDLYGIAISSLHKPWITFTGVEGLSQSALDNLLKKIKSNFILAEKMSLEGAPQAVADGGAAISDLVLVPILGDASGSGMLIFAQYNGKKISATERAIISYLSWYVHPLVDYLLFEQEMDKHMSRESVRAAIDPLTGLYSLEFLIGFLQQQLLFSARNKLAVSLLMIDVDRFSQINDALGQAVADTILVKLAEKLLSTIRSSDLLARYNSDKFVIVLPNTSIKGARVLGEKVRLEIEQTNFFAGQQPGPNITVSIGVAEFDPHDLNPESILKDAKIALQRAKETGRNTVAM